MELFMIEKISPSLPAGRLTPLGFESYRLCQRGEISFNEEIMKRG